MLGNFLQILAVISMAAISATKSEGSIIALKKLLHELTESGNLENDNTPNRLGHKGLKTRHHSKDSTNLMNIQTMNLFLKPNKRQQEEAEVKQWLRTEDRMCQITGRCGCTGSRCGTQVADDRIAEDVDKLVDEINRLPRDDDDRNNDQDNDDRDDERKKEREIHNIHEERVHERDDGDRDVNGETNNIGDEDYADEDDNETGKRLRCNGKKCFEDRHDQDLRNNDDWHEKVIKLGDDIDVVILDKSDLEKLLRNKNFKDLTRKDPQNNNIDQEIYQKVLAEYKKFISAYEKRSPQRSSITITPEEFFKAYESIKKQVLSKALAFVKHKRVLSFSKIKHLTLNQKRKLRRLKVMFTRGEIEEGDVEDSILEILFGENSSSQILAHKDNNNNIYIPQWLFDHLVSMKNNLRRNENVPPKTLRGQKRILPLTSQQRERMNNKKGKTLPKIVWRRNFKGQDAQKFGIPFDLEVQGLGQLAPQ